MSQLSLLPQAHALKDVVYTNDEVAKDIISHFQPSGYLLDPCKGDGAFYNNFPADCKKAYCEIDEGKDFFQFVEPVDYLFGNPPYKIFSKWMAHSMCIARINSHSWIWGGNTDGKITEPTIGTPCTCGMYQYQGANVWPILSDDAQKIFGVTTYASTAPTVADDATRYYGQADAV
jgi:hypothetical protein